MVWFACCVCFALVCCMFKVCACVYLLYCVLLRVAFWWLFGLIAYGGGLCIIVVFHFVSFLFGCCGLFVCGALFLWIFFAN